MQAVTIVSEGGAPAFMAATEFGLGAIAGALIVGAAFLAGFSAFRRSTAATCALVMVLAAALLQFGWLGLFNAGPKVVVLLQGLFGAAALVFLSATIRAARNNAVLGGLMFAGALTLVGVGAINLAGVGDAGALMRLGLGGVGAAAAALALFHAPRDPGARLILPGVFIALSAPLTAWLLPLEGAAAMLPHALFAFGILAASLVALTDGPAPRLSELGLSAVPGTSFDDAGHREAARAENAPAPAALAETQIAQVLDYSGIALWDWSPGETHHTASLPALIGAESRTGVSPDVMRSLIHKDDVAKFERKIATPPDGDGGFDIGLRLYDGRSIRVRGARAVNSDGVVDRIVAFLESAPDQKALRLAGEAPAASLAAKAKPSNPLSKDVGEAIGKGEIDVDFQPIVRLGDERVAGYEALARWRDQSGRERASAAELVRAADEAGKGGALALFMLKAAAEHAARQRRASPDAPVFVAMNASYSQLREKGFVEALRAARAEHNLPEKAIVVELTEADQITEMAEAAKLFADIKAAGASLAFDDFGAGFSSLGNLRRFSFDYLKIDKSFIDGLAGAGDGGKIAKAIAGLGRDLGLTVIAEGVETPATADAARAIGCDLAQGYAYGAPEGFDEKGAPEASPVVSAAASAPVLDPEPEFEPVSAPDPEPALELTSELAIADASVDARPEKKRERRGFWSRELR